MNTTIHGWPVISDEHDARLAHFEIPGARDRTLHLRADIGPYLVEFAARYHRSIARLDQGILDTWSWVPPRTGRASRSISDHCAGVAIDLNATKEGAQDPSNLETFWRTPLIAQALASLMAEFPLLEWGGNYTTFYDPMHWTFSDGVTSVDVLRDMTRLGIDCP